MQTLELSTQMQFRTEKLVNLLPEDQAKTERGFGKLEKGLEKTGRILARIAVLVRDHEDRLQQIANE